MFILLADTWHGPGPWILVVPLLWFALIALVVAVVARRGCGPRGRWAGQGGRAVLDERFARGEITADEYRQRRTVLDERAGR